jgi:hypothetical protein
MVLVRQAKEERISLVPQTVQETRPPEHPIRRRSLRLRLEIARMLLVVLPQGPSLPVAALEAIAPVAPVVMLLRPASTV